LVP
ncbi:hypothetical protein AZE42_13967, partial [Rhizopogon vesiculosus]|jgi:DNA polymerase alpha subunit A